MSTAKRHSFDVIGSSTADAARQAIDIIQAHTEVTWVEAHLNGEKNSLTVTGTANTIPYRLHVTPICCGIVDVQTWDTARILAEIGVFDEADALLHVISRPTPEALKPQDSTYRFVAQNDNTKTEES